MRALPPTLQAYAFRPAPQGSALPRQTGRALPVERVRDRALPATLQVVVLRVAAVSQAVAVLRVELEVQLAVGAQPAALAA